VASSFVTRFQSAFVALIATQAAHSIEEYVGRLYDVFPPARLVSGLVSNNLERGFVILNVALVTFGVWCLVWPVRKQSASCGDAGLVLDCHRVAEWSYPYFVVAVPTCVHARRGYGACALLSCPIPGATAAGFLGFVVTEER